MSALDLDRRNLVGAVSITRAFRITLERDLMLAFRRKGDFVNPFVFFVIVAVSYTHLTLPTNREV